MLDAGDDTNDAVWATFYNFCIESDPILMPMDDLPDEVPPEIEV